MKILAAGMNYARHNKEAGCALDYTEPIIFTKPDSALLRDGKPFFLPQAWGEISYEAEVVVHICRLGRHIAPRFARRYYDAATVGIDFTASALQRRLRQSGAPWELCKGFDGAAPIGRLVPLEHLGGDVQRLDFRLNVDGQEAQRGNTQDMLTRVDDLIAYASRFMTLKMGDLLFTGAPQAPGRAAIGQHLEGYLGEEKVLDFHIR